MDLGTTLGVLALLACLLAAVFRISEQWAGAAINGSGEMSASMWLTAIRGSKRIGHRSQARHSSRKHFLGRPGLSRESTPTYTGVPLGMALSTGMRSRNAGADDLRVAR